MTLELGWFSTARGAGSLGMFQRVLQCIDSGELDARIQFVFSNRERGEGEGSDHFFDLLAPRGIPLITHSSRRFRQAHGDFTAHRHEYDAQVQELVGRYSPDLCMLAGYLLILGPELCGSSTFLNLHPALPSGPKGLWDEVIWELINQHPQETGAMVFLVTEEVDEGPPMTFTRFPLHGPRFDWLWSEVGNEEASVLRDRDGEENPLFQAIRQEGMRREPPLVVETLKAFANGELRLHEGHLLDAQGHRTEPHDLTDQVEAALAAG